MFDQESVIRRVSFKFGFLISLSLIAYFLLIKHFHLLHVPILRIGYSLLFTLGMILAIYNYKTKIDEKENCFPGFYFGYLITITSTLLFIAFLYFYITPIEPNLLTRLSESLIEMHYFFEPSNLCLNTSIIPIIILFENFVSGILISFLVLIVISKKANKNRM